MRAPQLNEHVRERLVALMADDRPDGDRLLTRLRAFRTLESVPACTAVIHLLTQLSFREDEAEQLLTDLLEHRRQMLDGIGRDPGLRVAAMDYLSNVRPLLRDPAVAEQAELLRTGRAALSDPLTQLYDRRYARQALDLEIRRSQRSAEPLSLLTLDLDAFRSVNDLYGTPFGDLVLEIVGKVLRRCVREADTAARVGGEEFLIIFPTTGRLGAYAAAERIRTEVERQFSQNPIGDRVIAMTLSGGIAAHPFDGQDATTLLSRADQALRQSKIRGGNRISLYHSERRRNIRYDVRPGTRLTLSEPGGADSKPARLLNLSRTGALVEPDFGVAGREHDDVAGTQLRFALQPAGPLNQRPLVGAARVVRSMAPDLDKSGSAPRAPRLALEFGAPLPDDSQVSSLLLSTSGRSDSSREEPS